MKVKIITSFCPFHEMLEPFTPSFLASSLTLDTSSYLNSNRSLQSVRGFPDLYNKDNTSKKEQTDQEDVGSLPKRSLSL